MLDLGNSFLQSVERSPNALALVDGDLQLTYAQWYRSESRVADRGFADSASMRGDRLLVVLQNRWEMATLHWACQFAGIVIVPLNWRAKPDELDYCVTDAEAKAIVYEPVSADAVARLGGSERRASACRWTTRKADESTFDALLDARSADAQPRRAHGADDCSLMLYTSGTTGKPKGVPRRHRPNAPPRSRMSRRTCTRTANARSA